MAPVRVIDYVVVHELAHLIAFGRNRGRRIQPHGAEWKQACADDAQGCYRLSALLHMRESIGKTPGFAPNQ